MNQGFGNGDKILRQFLINIFKNLISKVKTVLYSKILLGKNITRDYSQFKNNYTYKRFMATIKIIVLQ